MSLLNKLFNFNKQKDYGSTTVTGGLELLSKLTASTLSKTSMLDQYGKSLYVYACISKIAQKTASNDYNLFKIMNSKGDVQEVFSHPILDLLYKPNPFQTKTDFLEILVINLKCTGDAFIFKVRNDRGNVVEMWNLRPDMMTIITDPTDFIKGYKFAKADGTFSYFKPEDIIHIKYPDPLNQYFGLSPLHAAQKRVQTEEFATSWQRDFFLNSARPDALIKNPQNTLSKDQKDDIREGWNKLYRGKGNSSKVAILEGGLEYQLISISQKEMDYIESMKFTRDDILVAFHTPKPIVSITDDVNRANAETAMYIFLSETIKPEISRIWENFNEQLIYDEFGEEFYIDFDDPTPANRELQLKEYKEGIESNYLLINEAREMEGREPIKGGWSFYMPVMNQAMGGLSVAEQKALFKKITENSDDNERIIKNNKKVKCYSFKGRSSLYRKFEMLEALTKAVDDSVKKVAAKKIENNKTKCDCGHDNKKGISIIGSIEVKKNYVELINKKIDSQITNLKDASDDFFQEQAARVISSLKSKKGKAIIKKINALDIFDMKSEVQLSIDFIIPYIEDYLKAAGMESLTMLSPQDEFITTDKIKKSIKKRAKEFAESVSNTTLTKLDATLAEGISASEGIKDLTDRVGEVYKEFPTYRSEAIARTEATNANAEGALEGYKQSDVATGKEWIADASACDICLSLDGEITGLNEKFSGGDDYPPAHVNCRCVLGPAFIE